MGGKSIRDVAQLAYEGRQFKAAPSLSRCEEDKGNC
jgi:hypothetical protein